MPPVLTSQLWQVRFSRLTTTAKLIVILSFALMPLGIIALLASLESSRTSDEQRRAELRVATTEATRKLATELTADLFALRRAVTALDSAPEAAACAQADVTLRSRGRGGVPFAVFGPAMTPLCTTRGVAITRPSFSIERGATIFRRDGNVLEAVVVSPFGGNVAVIRYAPALLAALARPEGYAPDYEMTIDVDGAPITVVDRATDDLIRGSESVSMPVGFDTLSLSMTVNSVPFGAAEALLTFLPLLMWASAAIIAFYVVDRLLIRPLKTLRAAVGTYQPGSARRVLAATHAVEIRELEESFSAYADRLAERERDIAQALTDQVKLTREVHHRVKNNLQVIASLISLHSRDSVSPDAERAYASIQRRVDALAIVHRNHFAELETNNGIEAKTLLSELVASFRVNAKASGGTPSVTLASVALCVSQDAATPLAFLFTELAEMALLNDPNAPVAVSLVQGNAPRTARLTISSPALPPRGDAQGSSAFRIIEGLARQLRAPLEFDPAGPAYRIDIPTL